MQRTDNIVDNLAATVQELATELKKKMVYLREQHELLKQLEELEPNSKQPIKTLRERVELLQTIGAYESLGFEPMQKLRGRLRTLKLIKKLEPNGLEPIEDLRGRLQAPETIKALEPRRSEWIEDLREPVRATAMNTGRRNALSGEQPAVPERERESFALSAATSNRLLCEQWNEGGKPDYDQDLLDLGLTKEEARIDDGTLSGGRFGAVLNGPSPSICADAYPISDPRVLQLLPLFELTTSDPIFDGELSSLSADDPGAWEDDVEPFPLSKSDR